jgi:hypothetical protein
MRVVPRLWLVSILTLASSCDAGPSPARPDVDHEADAWCGAHHSSREVILEAELATARLEVLMRELDLLDAKIENATRSVGDAMDQRDRNSALSRLRRLQREQAELKQRAAKAHAAARQAESDKAAQLSTIEKSVKSNLASLPPVDTSSTP